MKRGSKALGKNYLGLLEQIESIPEEMFNPNVLFIYGHRNEFVKLGPLGMFMYLRPYDFELRRRDWFHPETKKRYILKTIWRKGLWNYLAVATFLNLPHARVAEKIFHPDYYLRSPMTPKRIAGRFRYIMQKLRSQPTAVFMNWFDNAYRPGRLTIWRGYYNHPIRQHVPHIVTPGPFGIKTADPKEIKPCPVIPEDNLY